MDPLPLLSLTAEGTAWPLATRGRHEASLAASPGNPAPNTDLCPWGNVPGKIKGRLPQESEAAGRRCDVPEEALGKQGL